MRKCRLLLGIALAVLLTPAFLATARQPESLAAAQGTELWGGPGAKGVGNAGARFDTSVTVSSVAAATGTVEYFVGGSLVATQSFTLPARGATTLTAPAVLTGAGAFLYRVKADSPVNAWSETYNDTAAGRFSVSTPAFTASDFLNPGDEASGGGADASTSTGAGRGRTNVGILCNPNSAQACRLEITAYDGGVLLGTASIEATPGSVGQRALSELISASSGHSGLALRLRLLAGSGQPYAIKNDNLTSDGAFVPLQVNRSAFSTAPSIATFIVTPDSGCAPLTVSLSWTTAGASRVTISGVSGNLPPNGSTTVTINATTDLVLTAFSDSGDSASVPRKVSVTPAAHAPVPSPNSGTFALGGTLTGTLPFQSTGVKVEFVQQQSAGSTFELREAYFTYKAGSTAGTDIVKLSVQGTCGEVSALFTAIVLQAGAPLITSFESNPAIGCRPANIILSWTTENASQVELSASEVTLSPNGSYGLTIDATSTFKLTAYGINTSQRTSVTLTVPVDERLQYPILSTSGIFVAPGEVVEIVVTGVDDINRIGYYITNLQNGAIFQPLSKTRFRYTAGSVPGNTDTIRITYTNGCGTTYSEFRATVR